MLKDNKILSVRIWRYLVNFWAIFLYGVIIFDFYTRNQNSDFLGPVSAVYIAVLAVYSAQKEFERWHDYYVGRHPGEIYVFIWTILIVALFISDLILKDSYKIPEQVFTTYIVVIGILAITKKSKRNYRKKKS